MAGRSERYGTQLVLLDTAHIDTVRIVGTVGALANWTIPITAILAAASGKDPSTINPTLTAGKSCLLNVSFLTLCSADRILWSLHALECGYQACELSSLPLPLRQRRCAVYSTLSQHQVRLLVPRLPLHRSATGSN